MRRILLAAFLVAVLQPALAQDAPAPASLAVIDLRPAQERGGTGLAPLDGKCNKDVFRIADVATDPLKVAILRSLLTDRLSVMGEGKTLTILNWSIYYNKQVQGGGGRGLQSVGIQGYQIPTKTKERRAGSKCSRQESAGGWYEGSEIHSVYFPIISEFTGTFGGKPVSVRVVHSPNVKLAGKFQGETNDTQALLDTVEETTTALLETIRQ